MDQLTNAKTKILLSVFLAFTTGLLLGCATQNVADVTSHSSKRILDIIINENSESLILIIKGNQTLTYTSDKQINPNRILFYFPDTILESFSGLFLPPDNEIISSIMVDERVENDTTNSAVYITLKKDTPYDIIQDTDGLQVTFPISPSLPSKKKPQKKLAENKPEPRLAQKNVAVATILRTVTTEPFEDSVAVNVKADGTINNYKAFTMVNPDRIVFDLYNIGFHGCIDERRRTNGI